MKKNVKQYNFIKGMILSVLLFMLSTNTFGVDFKVGEFYFNILSEADLTVELTAPTYRGYYQGDIVIPEFVTYNKKKYRVVSLDEKSFRGCLFLNSLTIPRSVITSKASFSDCIRMTSVTLHCKKVTNYMFYCRSSLKKVVIGEEVESIGEKAFSGCTNLTSLIIPNGVKSMGKEAFSCCSNLNSLTISNGVELIGEYAFKHCVSLTSVTIPGSVKTIGNGAFWGCENLLTLVLSEGIQTIGSTAFAHCKKLTSLVIPYSIKNWGTKPFEYCSLNRVTVPKHYTTYDTYIFGTANIIKGEEDKQSQVDSTDKNDMTISGNVSNVDGGIDPVVAENIKKKRREEEIKKNADQFYYKENVEQLVREYELGVAAQNEGNEGTEHFQKAEEAIVYIRDYLEKKGVSLYDENKLVAHYARIEVMLGKYEEASKLINIVVNKVDPETNSEVEDLDALLNCYLLNYTIIYKKTGDESKLNEYTDKMKRLAMKLLEIDPNNETAKTILDAINQLES